MIIQIKRGIHNRFSSSGSFEAYAVLRLRQKLHKDDPKFKNRLDSALELPNSANR